MHFKYSKEINIPKEISTILIKKSSSQINASKKKIFKRSNILNIVLNFKEETCWKNIHFNKRYIIWKNNTLCCVLFCFQKLRAGKKRYYFVVRDLARERNCEIVFGEEKNKICLKTTLWQILVALLNVIVLLYLYEI